ncbi:Sfum_1244 family protein [Sulfuricystis multivorans]|uniref:Sfum_1244 family protein n=1 Tax=Sulfuricystis multivorans TaxID=2211108 RepID=UPI000F83899E|nr:Sfum_1244 family protein [Sulfuricystis multivorans]
MIPDFDRLVAAVQKNCHIADARHARGMTLCTYLLAMREFYRWEAGIAPGAPLERAAVGAWLNAREALWETLEGEDFAPLPVGDEEFAPFEVAAINHLLAAHGLVYGAGVGRFGRPHFFLGELERHEVRDGLTVLVSGREHARDLGALPAALQGDTAFVRSEALRQWLWEKAEAWMMKRSPGPMAEALAAHGFETDPHAALERMLAAELETAILHECGEHAAGRLLGAGWEERLACGSSRRAEILMRAVRDHLADSLVTLPTLLEREAWPSLLFWLANLDGMRRALWPALAGFEIAKVGAGKTALPAMIRRGAEHFEHVARRLLAVDDQAVEALSHDVAALALG